MLLKLYVNDEHIETEISDIVLKNSWMDPKALAKFLTDELFTRTWRQPLEERLEKYIEKVRGVDGGETR